MDSEFNPYQKWLGIPPKDQPPHHYRLLGVETFEADSDIIERAADRQMTYIRSLQNGEQSDHAQQLLNELSAAKVCLLDAGKKQQYDQALKNARQEQGLQPPPAISGGDSAIITATALPPKRPAGLTPPTRPDASHSASHMVAASSSGLKMAQPLAPVRPVAAAAPAIVVASTTAAIASTPLHLRQPASKSPASKSNVPLVLAAAGGFAAVALLGGLFALFLWPANPSPAELAQTEIEDRSEGHVSDRPVVTGNDNHVNNTYASNAPPRDPASDPGRTVESPVDQGPTDEPIVSSSETVTAPTGATPSTSSAHLVVEAATVIGKIAVENKILNDRDYAFEEVAPQLQDLQFTRWEFGPVPEIKFNVMQPGPVYLILPPRQYARPLPNINIAGWKATDLRCTIRVAQGAILPCSVYERETTGSSGAIPAGVAMWPMVAAAKLELKARILGDIVGNPVPTGGTDDPVDLDLPTDDPTQPPLAATDEPKKLTIPTSSAQATIRTRIVEVFELDSAKTPEEKMDAAKRMLETGSQPSENPVERFVLLASASRYAADAGDLDTALRSVDEIDKSYDAKAAAMRLYLVRQFAKSRSPKSFKLQQLNLVLPVLDQGLADDDFDAVDETVTDLFSNGLSHRALSDRRRIAREMKGKYRVVAAAKAALATSPDDGAANTIVGKYIAFHKLNWDDGLPLLAKSDVAELQKLAKADLANPESAKEQMAIGKGWFQLVDQEESEQSKGALLTRAEDWYRKALPTVEGLSQAEVKTRLDDIQQQLVDLGWVDLPKQVVITAASGRGCEVYFNGEKIIDTFTDQVGTATVTVKRGDLLMVHARKSTFASSSMSKGFACVVAFEGNSPASVAGKSNGWNAFAPADSTEWYEPAKVARTLKYVVSPSAGHTLLNQQTGIAARSIWHAVGNTSDAYFYYRVQ